MRKNIHWIILVLLILAYTILMSYLSIRRHDAFYSGYDLANTDQTIWNTLHGHFFSLTTGDGVSVSRFTIHSDIIMILLAPIYILWDNVRMLLIIQSFAIALSVIPIYLISYKLLKNKLIALILALRFLMSPILQWANLYDFHPVTLAIPLLFSTFYFAYVKKWRWFYIALILTLFTKEELGLTTAAMGLMIFFVFKERKHGLIAIAASLLWSFLMIKVVIPAYSLSGSYYFFTWLSEAKRIMSDSHYWAIPGNIVNNILLTPDRVSYLIFWLRSTAGLPLLGFPWLILSLPELAINLLSSHGQMRSFTLHYQSVILPGMTIATIFGLFYLKYFLQKIKITKKLAPSIVLVVIIMGFFVRARVNYHYGPLPYTPALWSDMYNVSESDTQFEKILQQIPARAVAVSSPEIKPHLSHRVANYTTPEATSSADFIALIDENRIVGDNEPKTYELDLVKNLKKNPDFVLVAHPEHFYLYKRKDFK